MTESNYLRLESVAFNTDLLICMTHQYAHARLALADAGYCAVYTTAPNFPSFHAPLTDLYTLEDKGFVTRSTNLLGVSVWKITRSGHLQALLQLARKSGQAVNQRFAVISMTVTTDKFGFTRASRATVYCRTIDRANEELAKALTAFDMDVRRRNPADEHSYSRIQHDLDRNRVKVQPVREQTVAYGRAQLARYTSETHTLEVALISLND